MKQSLFLCALSAALLGGCATAKQGDDDDDVSTVDSGVARDGQRDGTTGSDATTQIDSGPPIDAATQVDASNCTPPIAGGTCDTAPQCGCGATQNCVHRDPNYSQTGCVNAGTVANYANCSLDGAGQCAKGSVCFGGTCHPYCTANTDCAGTAYRLCIQITNLQDQPIGGFQVCTQTCDPLSPQSDTPEYDPCGPSTNCFPASDRASSCAGPVGTGVQDSSCTTGNAGDATKCAAGYACISYTLLGVPFDDCMKMCRVGGATTQCPTGRTCRAFTTPQYAGPHQIGFCTDL